MQKSHQNLIKKSECTFLKVKDIIEFWSIAFGLPFIPLGVWKSTFVFSNHSVAINCQLPNPFDEDLITVQETWKKSCFG